MDWPGLDRWGTSEDDAIEKLLAYAPRYAGVAERAGLAKAFAMAGDVEVVERVPGSSSTDFWGIAHVPSQIEIDILPRPTWNGGSISSARAGPLRRGRGPHLGRLVPDLGAPGGRASRSSATSTSASPSSSRARSSPDATGRGHDPGRPQDHRPAYLAAIRAYNADGKPARTWPIQFLVRRTAHHVMDHAWELEDRDPARQGPKREPS